MEAKFEAVHAELAPHYKGRLKPTPSDYQARGAIFLPENSRFSRLLSLPGTANLAAVAKRSPSFLGRAEALRASSNARVSERFTCDALDPFAGRKFGLLGCHLASLQKQRRSREVWCRHVYSQLKASPDRAI
jgi:hypothetical protein